MPISIPTTSTAQPTETKPFTLYHIRLPSALRASLQKRYSDFVALDTSLKSETGAPPPASLPAKSWLKRTVNNPELTEDRRRGLESYLQAIESSGDSRWRQSTAWRTFLGLDSSAASEAKRPFSSMGQSKNVTAAGWLDMHRALKGQLHEARLALTRREQAQTSSSQHAAGAQAKSSLVQAGTMIRTLDEALNRFSGGKGNDGGYSSEKLGDGEIRRRRDLISTARKEREGLEGVLNSLAIKSVAASAGGSDVPGAFPPSAADKEDLLTGRPTGGGQPSSRRVLGAPLKETERTRELDNEGVLQLQKQVMQEQDLDAQDLAKVVRRMREMGVQMNEELLAQAELLDVFDQDVDRVSGKVDVAKKRISKLK